MKLFFCNYHKLERDIHIDQQFRATPNLDHRAITSQPFLLLLVMLPPFTRPWYHPPAFHNSDQASRQETGLRPSRNVILNLYSLLCSPSLCSPSSCLYSVSWEVLPLIAVHVIVVLCCHHLNWSQRLRQVIVVLCADIGLLSAVFRPLRTVIHKVIFEFVSNCARGAGGYV